MPTSVPRTVAKATGGHPGMPSQASVSVDPPIVLTDDGVAPIAPLVGPFDQEFQVPPSEDEYETAGLAELFGPLCSD